MKDAWGLEKKQFVEIFSMLELVARLVDEII
jgi:hypothetical protein